MIPLSGGISGGSSGGCVRSVVIVVKVAMALVARVAVLVRIFAVFGTISDIATVSHCSSIYLELRNTSSSLFIRSTRTVTVMLLWRLTIDDV